VNGPPAYIVVEMIVVVSIIAGIAVVLGQVF
jgi:hypothetical protein